MLRSVLAASVLAISALPAAAGSYGCAGDCYRQQYVAPTYGSVTERYTVRAPRTYAITTPAQYGTVYDRVQVSPGGRTWSVTRDAYGNKVGCWITTPAQYSTVARTVMTQAPQVIPYAEPAQYGYRTQTFQTSQGYRAWVPTATPSFATRVSVGPGYDAGPSYGRAPGYGAGPGYGVRSGYRAGPGYGYGPGANPLDEY